MEILIGVIVALLLLFVIMYNSLIRKRNEVTNAFGSIDAMLKKRFDLIPNLVATVKQYAEHEQDTFSKITQMRTSNYSQMTDSEKAQFDSSFNEARRSFFMVAENYPDLKASTNFADLQRSLNETEEQLSAARRTYNSAVTDFNNAVQTFPSNILASMFGFGTKEVLSIPEQERETPDVKNLFKS